MIENLFTFVRTLGNQRIQGKKFFVTQVGLLGTVSDNSGSIGTAGKVLSSTGSGVSWITVGSGNSNVDVLNDLTDVVISTAAEGNLLRFNGTSWVNWAPNFLTGYGSLNDLSDVTLTTPVNGARLVYVSSTGQWIDAAPLAFGKIYYGSALGDAATTTVITNGTKLSIGTGAFSTNLNIGQVDITTGIAGQGSIHIGAIQDGSTYLLASNNKIQVGSQSEMIAPGEPGEEPTSIFTFTPSTLNIQPLGGDTVFGGHTTATGYKTPAGNRQELLTAAGTKTLTNSASNGQILRWTQPVGGVGNWQADDENTASTPSLDAVTDVGSTTTNSITVGGLSTSGTVTASVVTTPLIEREGVLTINSEEQVDQGEPNPNLLYVSWLGDNKFVINADGYAIATTGYKVVGGTASGFLKANGTIDTSTYLTSYTETQTLDAVTDLGSTTTNNISVGGLTSTSVSTPILQSNSGVLTIDADVNGGIQLLPGDPAEPILSFDWQGTTQGYIDTDAKITFQGFKTPTGTASGFLKANGTVDTSAYITGIEYLDDIDDVVLVNLDEGDVLRFDGTVWSNAPLSNYASKVQHEVKAGVAITKGQALYVTGASGTNMIVGKASNVSESMSSKTIGLAATSAAINAKFFVITEGLLDGLNTSAATIGDAVWLGVNGALIFGLANKPVAPAHLVYIGVVTRVNANNGEIFISIQNGFELKELHDVLINGVATGHLLRRDADGLWKNWSPNYITANSVDVLTNKRINLSTSIASIVNIDSIDPFIGQTDIVLYQDGIDKGGRIDVDFEGLISISNPGIGYYSGPANTEGGTTFLVTVSGNTLTGTIAEFNEALTDGDFATQAYVGTQIANLVDSAPATLNTLNELAAALGDDPNFATTVATSIGTKQNQLNGTGFVKASGTTISYDNSVYLTSESDPVFTASPAYGIAESNITKWDTAYLWGDHSTVGYLTSLPAHNHDDRYYTETEVNSLLSGKVSTDNFKVLGSGINYDVDRTLKIENGLAIYGAYIGGENSPYTYDIAAQFAFGSRAFEFSADWINEDGANLKLRTLRDCCTNWSPWVEVITSYNISSYALTSLPAHNHTIAEVTSLQTALDGKVPTTRTLTINGTAFDLSADRSWTIGSADGYISDVTLSESGTLKFAGQGSAFTGDIDLSTLPFQPIGTYLTAEADTFASVTGRGNSTDTALYLAGGSGGVPALHIRSGGSSWSEGLAIHPSTDSGYGLTFYRTRAAYTDQTNTWAIGNLGDGNALNHFGLLRKGLTGGVADRAGDAIFTINPTGAFKFGFNPYVGGNIIWHAGNDGDGSGLDADSVDGVHASNIVWGNARGTNDSVTTDADGLDKTGFYTSSGFVTRPEGVEWMYIQHIKLYNDNSQYQKQIGYDTYDDSMWVRTKSANNWSTWKPILTSENIGSYALTSLPAHTHTIANVTGLQTALDGKLSAEADTLDTVLSRGASTTRTAEFYQTSNTFVNTVSAGNRGLTVYQDTAGADAYMTFHIGGDYAGYFGLGGAENDLVWGGWSVGNARHRILHSGNFTNNSADWNAAYDWGNHAIAGYLTSLPAHNHDDRYYTETESDSRFVNTAGDTMTGELTLKYSTEDSSDYNGLFFAPYSDAAGLNDYIIKAASDKGVFGRKSFGWHVHSESAFGVYSNGWVKLFGVEGDTGNTQVFGNLTVSGSITESSSIRYKKDVVGIESTSGKVELLKPVRYKKIKDESEEIGLIAEDVAELFPEVVKYDNEGRPDGVNYSRLSVILLKAVQELTERVNKLENK